MRQTINESDRKGLIEYRLSRAEETIKEAIYSADGEYFNTAVNRLYYSAYYAASALLLANGLTPSSHAGVKTLLSLHFIRTGLLDIEYGKIFTMLFENRQSGDYEDFVYCDKKLFDSLLPQTIDFIRAVKQLIRVSIPDISE